MTTLWSIMTLTIRLFVDSCDCLTVSSSAVFTIRYDVFGAEKNSNYLIDMKSIKNYLLENISPMLEKIKKNISPML